MSISKKPSFRFSKIFPFIAIFILCCLFFWRVFLKAEIPFPGDFVVGIYHPWLDYKWGTVAGVPVKNPITADVPSFMYPMQTYAASLLKSGKWPLWNPYILGGAPLLANFQSAPFSPLSLFFILFPFSVAWTAQIIGAHILAAFFTYLLLRHWQRSHLAAIIGGIIFSFSGFNLIWSQWNGHVLTAACFPLIIYFLDRFLTKGGIRNCIGLSFAIALQIVAGYPQLLLYTALVMGIVFLFRFSFKKGVPIAIFALLGFTLAAAQFLPGKELLSQSQWMSEPHPRIWAFLPIEKTITFFAPDYFGNHTTKNYWGPQDYTSNTGFVGVGAGMLALLAAFTWKKNRGVKIAILVAAVGLILSYLTPLSDFLWTNNIFGMRSSSAHRALILFNLGIALLAGFGIDNLKNKKIPWKQVLLPIVFMLLIFAVFGIWAVQHNSVAARNLIFPTAILAVSTFLFIAIKKLNNFAQIFVVLFCGILVFEIFRFGWKFTPFSKGEYIFPDTPVTEFLKKQTGQFRISNGDTMPVNFQMSYKLQTLGGYETMRPFYSSQFIASMNNNDPSANPSGRYGIIDNDTSHLLDMANTKYYLTLKRNGKNAPDPAGQIPKKFDSKRFSVAFEDKSTVVMESKSALPRAFMVYDWEVETSDTATLEKILNPSFPISQKILLTQSPSISATKAKASAVKIVTYEAQKVAIQTNGNAEGMLFLSDAWFPGWKAFIDGKEIQIYRANYMFRAVEVPSGNHLIEFIYAPDSFSLGLKLSLISFVALLIILSYTNFRRT